MRSNGTGKFGATSLAISKGRLVSMLGLLQDEVVDEDRDEMGWVTNPLSIYSTIASRLAESLAVKCLGMLRHMSAM